MITIKIIPGKNAVNVVSVECGYALSETYAVIIKNFAEKIKEALENSNDFPTAVLLNGEPVAVEDFARFAMQKPEPHPYAVELEERDNLR